MIRFLLIDDQDAISAPNRDGDLPLHLACMYKRLSIAKLVYNSCPEALRRQNNDGKTPLDVARASVNNDEFPEVAQFVEDQLELERQARENVEPDGNGQLPVHRVLQTSEASLGSIKLMAAANPASLTTTDNQGFIPLHFACKVGRVNIVKNIVEADEEFLKVKTSRGELPLHLACLVNYILERSDYGVSLRFHGKLPIELLLGDLASCDRNRLEYVEAVYRLLRANPEVVADSL
ncbi:hypothetical protein ACHAWO_003132 [Cyclotella atomus]|uniref:Uncharacterized protein n=1 Tax=Cyclotella atomus TaxID=382360 RepID=A0ABD3QMZ2_9STRA